MNASEKRDCVHCGETFDAPEFWSFLLSKSTRELQCIRCQKTSYLVQSEQIKPIAMVLLIIALIISLAPVLLGLSWLIAFLTGYIDVLWMWAVIGTPFLSIALIGICIKTHRWFTHKTQKDLFELKMDI